MLLKMPFNIIISTREHSTTETDAPWRMGTFILTTVEASGLKYWEMVSATIAVRGGHIPSDMFVVLPLQIIICAANNWCYSFNNAFFSLIPYYMLSLVNLLLFMNEVKITSDFSLTVQFIHSIQDNWIKEKILQSEVISFFNNIVDKAIVLEASKIENCDLLNILAVNTSTIS